MQEFITAAEEADSIEEGERPDLIFKIDDREVTAYYPGDGQLAVYMATNASFSSRVENVAGAVNFFVSVFDEDTHSWLVSRLLDRTDRFGIAQITDILKYMIKEWTGNPTDEPSGSTSSPQRVGRKSTARTPALT